MSYFFSSEKLETGKTANVSGEEARHILLSRRAKKGEKVLLQDLSGKRFETEILSADKKSLSVLVGEEVPAPKEPDTEIILLLALVQEKALDVILQKATELGA